MSFNGIIVLVPKNSYLDHKNRLDKLLGLLKSREIWTTLELSRVLRVSLRYLDEGSKGA